MSDRSGDTIHFETKSTAAPPLVTAVIPYYNRADTLPRALRSIEQQTYPDIEIVIVDDCSATGPEGVVAKMGLRRKVSVVRQPENRGASAARNAGMRAARGRFIAFLDSDDEWLPEKIEEQMRLVAQCDDWDNIFCLSRTCIDWGDGRRTLTEPWNPAKDSAATFLFVRCGYLHVNSILLSSAIGKRLFFNEALKDYEDNLFVVEAAAQGARMLFAESAVSVYYRDGRPDQMTNKSNVENGYIFLDCAKGLLTKNETTGFIVQMMGDSLSSKQPATMLKYCIVALRDKVLTAHRIGGLLYWYFLKRPFFEWRDRLKSNPRRDAA